MKHYGWLKSGKESLCPVSLMKLKLQFLRVKISPWKRRVESRELSQYNLHQKSLFTNNPFRTHLIILIPLPHLCLLYFKHLSSKTEMRLP
jgi:hypothetical protein